MCCNGIKVILVIRVVISILDYGAIDLLFSQYFYSSYNDTKLFFLMLFENV